MFPPYLDLSRLNKLAELKQCSIRFAHVVENHKSFSGDALSLQHFLSSLTQRWRIRHILVVLRDLPTQDHMTSTVHLNNRDTHARLSGGLFFFFKQSQSGPDFRHYNRLAYLGYYCVADGTSHVVEVDVNPIWTALFKSCSNIFSAVVDGRSEAQIIH